MGAATMTPVRVSTMLRIGACTDGLAHQLAPTATAAVDLIRNHNTVAVVPDQDVAIDALILMGADADWAKAHVEWAANGADPTAIVLDSCP